MSWPELRECPFCGTNDHLSVSPCGSLTSDMPARPHRVVCNHLDCESVQGPVAFGQLAAIAAWNTRPQAPQVDGLVEYIGSPELGTPDPTALRPSQGWQPIETAPEAWIDVLVFSPEHEGFNCGGVFSAFYDDDDGLWLAHTQGENMQLNPTAWQPLPTPPENGNG